MCVYVCVCVELGIDGERGRREGETQTAGSCFVAQASFEFAMYPKLGLS